MSSGRRRRSLGAVCSGVMGGVTAPSSCAGAEDVAGPTASPVEAEEIVVSGATVVPHVSRPRQASLGPRRFASILDFGVPIMGPGATVDTVETRVPRAGLPGAT